MLMKNNNVLLSAYVISRNKISNYTILDAYSSQFIDFQELDLIYNMIISVL